MKQQQRIFLLCLLFPLSIFSQLVVTPNSSAAALAQAILGNGVSVSNASVNCGANGIGTFTYSGSTLGLTNGIILTSGLATDASMSAQIVSNSTGNIFTDPDLATVTSGSQNDVCYIAFDFVPLCNQISVTYEFGSSEYQGFQCSNYNDGFGLFLTGPDPAGGTYSSANVATLPSGTPVSINNINNGQSPCTSASNPSYYIDNTSGTDVVYEGLTTAITSVKAVVPCSTYHMKIAICDISDEAYDSGVFIQGNSINCANTPTITASTTPSNCSSNTGTASVTVTNYTGTPTYTWSPGGQNTASISGLAAGTYTCLVGLNLGCGNMTQTVMATVTQSGSTLSLTTSSINPSCNGSTNGSATVNISGGAAPFTTSWNTIPVQNTTTASNLAGGTYVVSVNDNAGCTQTATVTLINPAPIVASTTTTPSNCGASNGSASATVSSGGTGAITYTWSPGGQTTSAINNIGAGTYTVLISDANSCTVSLSAVVNSIGSSLSLTTASINPSCNNGTNGSATVNTSGGTAPFTYSWNTAPVQNTSAAVNLGAGTYIVSVQDNAGCSQTATVTLTNPAPIVVTTTTTPSTCSANNGTATGNVTSGGTAPFTYAWSTTPVQNTQTANGLSSGSYILVISDVNSCTATATASVAVNGSTLALTTSTVNPLCNGGSNGSVTVNIAGGAAPFITSWNTAPIQTTTTAINLSAGSYIVSVTDNSGCTQTANATLTNPPAIFGTTTTTPSTCSAANGSATANVVSGGTAPFAYIWSTTPVQNAQTAIGLAATTYTVLISDVNSCTYTTTATVALQNGGWTLTANTTTNVACFGGSNGAVAVTINNPAANIFTYAWNTSPAQSTQTASNVPAGNFTVTVADANGCVQAATYTVTQPIVLTASTAVAPTTCTASVGSSTVTAAGGTVPYSYSWNTTPAQVTAVANNLPAGNFVATVTDANGCIVTANSAIVTQTQNISVTAVVTAAKCGSPTGSVMLTTVTGGTSPYTYVWNSIPSQTAQNLTNVVPGNYNVFITDAYGCTLLFPESVGNIPGLPLTTSSTAEKCSNSMGTAFVTAGGTGPYQYLWNTNPVQTTKTATGLSSGNYQVVVIDAYGCTDSAKVNVTNVDDILTTNFNTLPLGEINVEDAIVISISANQGWSLDTANLSGFGAISSSQHHTFYQYGMYYASYYYTSSNGCKDSVVYPIKVNDYMTLYIPNGFTPNGDGLNDNFHAAGTFIKEFEMYIYDRWGKLVIKLDNIEKSWDGKYAGKDAMEDTYVYKGRATDVFGKHTTFQGQISLVK